MAESSLSLQLSDFAAEVAQFLGYGRTASNWTGWQVASPYVPSTPDTQLGQIMSCIQAGLRQFYYPRLTPDQPVAYKFSFLTPQRSLVTAVNVGIYDLPDDFQSMEGEFTYQPTDSTWLTIRRLGIGQISRMLQQNFGVTQKPVYCATYPKQSDQTQGQRWAISFFPVPDNQYTLTYSSNVLPSALSVTNPFPLGGAAHGETILESCLAVAESRLQDEAGNHQEKFLERLQASIAVDTRDNKPAYLGYNGDASDRCGWDGYAPWSGYGNGYGTITTGVTWNGQFPG